MSELASSCEHLSIDKTCTAFSDNLKAQTIRQLKCKSNQKNVCCYLCLFRSQCVISCKYLGQSDNCVELKPETDVSTCSAAKDLKVESLQLENVPVAFCFSCNEAMVWAKAQFTVDSWCGNKSLLANDDYDKVLPVTILLCPKCGKLEFKADLSKKVKV